MTPIEIAGIIFFTGLISIGFLVIERSRKIKKNKEPTLIQIIILLFLIIIIFRIIGLF